LNTYVTHTHRTHYTTLNTVAYVGTGPPYFGHFRYAYIWTVSLGVEGGSGVILIIIIIIIIITMTRQ